MTRKTTWTLARPVYWKIYIIISLFTLRENLGVEDDHTDELTHIYATGEMTKTTKITWE